MNNDPSYFCVTATFHPWDGTERTLRAYSRKDHADRASAFVRSAYMDTLPGGIDVRVREYAGKIISTPGGLRLENTPKGALTLIKTAFDKNECIFLLSLTFNGEVAIHSRKRCQPTTSVEDYACVKVEKGEKESVAGYYHTDELAKRVFAFLAEINRDSDLRFSVCPYRGTLMNSESGIKWLEIAGKMEEVKTRLDLKEYRRLVEIGEEKPIAWDKPANL